MFWVLIWFQGSLPLPRALLQNWTEWRALRLFPHLYNPHSSPRTALGHLDNCKKPKPHFRDKETEAGIQTSFTLDSVQSQCRPGTQWASKVCSWHMRVGAVLAGPTGDFSCLERQEVPPCTSLTLI